MPQDAVVTTRIERPLAERLEGLARATRRSRSWLAAEAIRAYVEENAWQIEEIEAGIAELEAGKGIGEAEAAGRIARLKRGA